MELAQCWSQSTQRRWGSGGSTPSRSASLTALILSTLGIRAAESPARARKLLLAIDMRASTGQRMVLTWHPILELSEADVWQQIADAALEYHPVYDAIIPRLIFRTTRKHDSVSIRAGDSWWTAPLGRRLRFRPCGEKQPARSSVGPSFKIQSKRLSWLQPKSYWGASYPRS